MPTSKFDEYRKMRDDIKNINPNRGGSPNQSKGYYAEVVNATENNLQRIKKGIGARVIVIDNNGASDAIITYTNGQTGREIQDKVGYTYSQLKQRISSGKYDDMIFSINKDHPIFSNQKQLSALEKVAKEHNIKIISSDVTEKEVLALAKAASIESHIRKTIGIDDNKAPITATGYTVKRIIDDSIKDTKEFVFAQTGRFMSENFKQIHAAGVDEAVNSAMFAAAFSTAKNVHSVIKGEESASEAVKEILYDTASASVLGYATGAVMEKFNIGERSDAAFLVNGVVQVTKQVVSYVNGNINEEELLSNVAETTALIAAARVGKIIGATAATALATSIMGPAGAELGAKIGAIIGEMITTAICTEIITTIKDSREFNKQNARIISLYRRAEHQIRESQVKLEEIIQAENNELRQVISESFQMIASGINNNSSEDITAGLIHMGNKFGLTEEDFIKNKVTRSNLPDTTEEWVFS